MFRKKIKTEPQPLNIDVPNETVISVGDKTYWVKGGKKYLVPSKRVLDSYGWRPPVVLTEEAANRIPTSNGKILFRGGTAIRSMVTYEVFLISDNKRRLVTSPDTLDALGLNNIVLVSEKEVNMHERGEDIV